MSERRTIWLDIVPVNHLKAGQTVYLDNAPAWLAEIELVTDKTAQLTFVTATGVTTVRKRLTTRMARPL